MPNVCLHVVELLSKLDAVGFRIYDQKEPVNFADSDVSNRSLQRWAPLGVYVSHAVQTAKRARPDEPDSRVRISLQSLPTKGQKQAPFVTFGPSAPTAPMPLASASSSLPLRDGSTVRDWSVF